MNSDTQLECRQSHLLTLRLHASRDSVDFQRREAGIDRVPSIGGRHAANSHVGVADRLELFQSMARYDLVKSRELLVQEPDERSGLHAFGH